MIKGNSLQRSPSQYICFSSFFSRATADARIQGEASHMRNGIERVKALAIRCYSDSTNTQPFFTLGYSISILQCTFGIYQVKQNFLMLYIWQRTETETMYMCIEDHNITVLPLVNTIAVFVTGRLAKLIIHCCPQIANPALCENANSTCIFTSRYSFAPLYLAAITTRATFSLRPDCGRIKQNNIYDVIHRDCYSNILRQRRRHWFAFLSSLWMIPLATSSWAGDADHRDWWFGVKSYIFKVMHLMFLATIFSTKCSEKLYSSANQSLGCVPHRPVRWQSVTKRR